MVSVMSIYILIKEEEKGGNMCTLISIYSNKSGEKLKKYVMHIVRFITNIYNITRTYILFLSKYNL